MTITIKEFIEERKRQLTPLKENISELNEDIQVLSNDPKIKQYLEKKNELEEKSKQLEQKEFDFYKNIQETCPHPMYYSDRTYSSYGREIYKTKCIMCTQEYNGKDKLLYDKKRLLGSQIIEQDYYEGRVYHIYKPICTAEEALEYYYELYQKVIELKDKGFDIIEEFNIEDKLWEHFCNPQTKTKTKRRI